MKQQTVFWERIWVRTAVGETALVVNLSPAGIKKEEVKFYVLHQANVRILDSVAKKLEEDLDKFPKNLDKLGNTSGASVPLLLDDIIRDGSLKKGDIIVISGFGAGLTWGSMVMRY